MSGKVTIASKNTLFCKKENRLLSGSRSNRVRSSNQPYCFVKSDSEVGRSVSLSHVVWETQFRPHGSAPKLEGDFNVLSDHAARQGRLAPPRRFLGISNVFDVFHSRSLKTILNAAAILSISLLAFSCKNGPSPSVTPGGGSSVSGGRVMLGIDVLEADQFAFLKGKRVGLITNQTSVNGRGIRTRQVLHRDPRVNLVALFTPEHGLDGTEKAAAHISTRRDPLTGLTAHSLYGPTRKPSTSMLRGVDVMLFDLQDIGSRSYTYISTMVLAMEACGENGVQFVVLDRPNPLGGNRINGPGIEKRWISFVGQVPVPYVHGMTSGEIARMTNAKGWNKRRCNLVVVPMRGWNRGMNWENTGLHWIATSPNIPHTHSPHYYAATGIFGSLSGGDIGIGTNRPFEYIGGKGVNAGQLKSDFDSMNFSGVNFDTYQSTRKPGWAGVQLKINPNAQADIVGLNVFFIDSINRRMTGSRDLFATTSSSSMNIFNKVYGSESIKSQLKSGVDPRKIVDSWRGYHAQFRSQRAPYLLYR